MLPAIPRCLLATMTALKGLVQYLSLGISAFSIQIPLGMKMRSVLLFRVTDPETTTSITPNLSRLILRLNRNRQQRNLLLLPVTGCLRGSDPVFLCSIAVRSF